MPAGIILCLTVYTALIPVCLRMRRFAREKREWMSRSIGAVLLFNTLALVIFLMSLHGQTVTGLIRGRAGSGGAVHELEMEVEGVTDREDMQVTITDRAYTAEQEQKYLRQCKEKLRDYVLGGNKKVSRVTKDLHLTRQIPGNPTRIDWRLDRYDVMNSDGEIDAAAVDKEGTPVTLTAHLTCGKAQEETTLRITVYPRSLEDRASYVEAVGALVRRADQSDPTGKQVRLPDSVGGRKIRWRKKKGKGGYLALLAGPLCAVVFYEERREKRKREAKRRAQMTEIDYPRIIMTFSLLLRAGLTSRRAMAMIAEDYESRRKPGTERPGYEALAAGIRQMEAGIAQEQVYLDLGRTSGSSRFERFGNLLAQNLRRGSGGLADQLAREAQNAFEERKAHARKRGEEAQIKLLLPMLMLFGIVLMAVMVPAFLSMQI